MDILGNFGCSLPLQFTKSNTKASKGGRTSLHRYTRHTCWHGSCVRPSVDLRRSERARGTPPFLITKRTDQQPTDRATRAGSWNWHCAGSGMAAGDSPPPIEGFGNMHRGMQERRGATKGSSGVRASLSFGGGEGPKEIPAGNFSPSFAALCVRRNRHRRVVRAIPARGHGTVPIGNGVST